MPPEKEFDVVASVYQRLPPDQRTSIHQHMFQSLKSGGILILEAFTPAQSQFSSGGPEQVELPYTQAILRRDFLSVDALELTETEIELNEGKMHFGKAAVVRVVFRTR